MAESDGSSGRIEVDPRSWTGVDDEGPSLDEFCETLRSATPEARARYLVDGFRISGRRQVWRNAFLLVGGLMLLDLAGAINLLAGLPAAYARYGPLAAVGRAAVALLMVAALPLVAQWLWRYIKQNSAEDEANVRRTWWRLRADTRRPLDPSN